MYCKTVSPIVIQIFILTSKSPLFSHFTAPIPREDVATALLRLAELPKGQGDGLALDLTSGDVEIKEAVSQAVKRNRTDWVG